MNELYLDFIRKHNDNFRTYFEVGVGDNYAGARCRQQAEEGKLVHFFEPRPNAAENLRSHTKDKDNVFVHEVAIADREGEETLTIDDGLSSYLDCVKEDTPLTQRHRNKIKVKTAPIHNYDKGDIEILVADVEGCEYFLLKHLISSPYLIQLEVLKTAYTRPKEALIMEWMKENNYKVGWKDSGGWDTVFLRKDFV